MTLARVRLCVLAWLLAAAAGAAPAFGQGSAEPDPDAALLQSLQQYRALEAAGGWAETPGGPALKIPDSGPSVAALRRRLAIEGFACGESLDPAAFDPALDCAVRLFQERRGLTVDGVVGPETRGALNVSASDRVRQIETGLRRQQSLPERAADRIEVNVAAAEATLYRAGAAILTTRIIAGRPSTPTPVFDAHVQGVIVNPPWIVPDSIARNEILPRAAREPGYLAANNFVRQNGQLVQLPGADNALGRIKLDMPNPHTVYLHDTPARALFEAARRYFSHGCMRMQKPREMAAALLEDQGWTLEAIDDAIEDGETRTIPLTAPVPVHVYYQTAYVLPDGALMLLPDVYGLDLRAETEPESRVAETECSLAAG